MAKTFCYVVVWEETGDDPAIWVYRNRNDALSKAKEVFAGESTSMVTMHDPEGIISGHAEMVVSHELEGEDAYSGYLYHAACNVPDYTETIVYVMETELEGKSG